MVEAIREKLTILVKEVKVVNKAAKEKGLSLYNKIVRDKLIHD